MRCDISAFEFRDVEINIRWNELDRREIKLLLVDRNTQKELMTALKGTLAVVSIVVEDFAFFLI